MKELEEMVKRIYWMGVFSVSFLIMVMALISIVVGIYVQLGLLK